MVAYNKFNAFVRDLVDGVHDFTAATHVFKTLLTSVQPTAANSLKADVTEVSVANGYTPAGGITIATAVTLTTATAKVATVTNPVWTGSGGGFTFRSAVLWNDTPATPLDPLVAWWDYGASQLVGNLETITVDYDDTAGIFTIT